MSGETNWQASVIEHRTAWIVAACCLLLIFIASLKPDLFTTSPEQVAEAEVKEERAKPLAKHLPATIAEEPERIEPEPVAEPIKPKTVIAPAKPVVKKEVAKQPVIKAAPSADEPGSGFYVQLGAFKEKPRAQGLIDQLRHHGWSGVLSKKTNGLYAVWAGPEQQRAEADKLQIAIEKKMKTRGFIVHQKGT
ncbi:hypothetical protein F3F96_02565 [Mariprofundus sp. NF]|uniref:SPOR domain-containing protein n=1 Tax=Mariprofundus sp. NF TaxID=2608716 RepID=UPI0015A150FE|nr:SPOR domain-containing protein [Mariprofundus sp. NF]NWF38023.1 hypothetical protein [Mariprofundus sp. NF]